MANIIDKEIVDITTSWEDYAGQRVEEFIKKMFGVKIGYHHISSNESGLTTVRCFADEDSFAKWGAAPDANPSLLLSEFSFYSSGATSVDYTLVARITQVPVATTVKGADNVVKFVYNSYYGDDIGDLDSELGYLNVVVNATPIEELAKRLESGNKEYSFDLGPYLTQETNTVKITIGNNHGKSRSWTYTLSTKQITLGVHSSFDESLLRDSNWLLRVACSGSAADVHLLVDGNKNTEQTVNINNSSYDFAIDVQGTLSFGRHTITIYAENKEYGIKTDTITVQFIKRGLTSPTVCIGKDASRTATMYGAATIPYFFYFPNASAGDVVTVQFETRDLAGGLIESLGMQKVKLRSDLTSGMQMWNLALENDVYSGTTIVPTITVGNDKAGYQLKVEAAGVNIAPANECKVLLTAKGKTNADEDAEDWHATYKGERTCTVVRSGNFKLNAENGFLDNKFVIRPGKRITLDGFKPFAADFGVNSSVPANRTGKSIEIELETGNCSNMDTVVCSCVQNGVGFVIYANRVELMCSTGSVVTPFADETRIRVGICVDGHTTHCVNNPGNSSVPATTSDCNMGYIYLNGEIVRMFDYEGAEWRQPAPQNIVIGSDDCEVILYTFRMYDKSLNYQQMLNNRVFDHPDITEKIAIALRNDVLDSDNKVSLSKVLIALPNTPYCIWDMKEMPTSKSDPRTCDRTEFYNPEYLYQGDYARAPFTALAHEINGDGTSSNNYPLPYKNWAETFEFAATLENPWLLNIDDRQIAITKFSISPGVEMAETEFVHKVNFASSESIFNILTMNEYHNVLLAAATAASGYPDLLSAPMAGQEAQGKPITYRHSLSGFPETGWRRTYENGKPKLEFISIYNFISNKYSPSILGYDKKKTTNQAWEVDDNINFFMTELPAATWNEESNKFVSQATTLYYARVPKKSLATGEKFGVAGNSSQLSQANSETAALRRVHNWLYATNPNVAERYKARYGDYRAFTVAADGFTSKKYGDLTYTKDTPAYRHARFADEYANYLNKWSVIFYFVWFNYHLGTDSMDKNMTIACDDVSKSPAIWHLKPRDSDTINLFNNSGIYRWKFFHEWGDSFNVATGETGRITGEIFNATNGSYEVVCTTGTPVFNGRLSGIFDCAVKLWENDIKNLYVAMRSGGLNSANMLARYESYWKYYCENLYNADGMGYANTGNFNMAYGDKLELNRYFYKYRERYMDSKYATGLSQSNALMLRLWTRGKGVALRHYCPIYASLNWGSGGVKNIRNIFNGQPAYFENGITASGSNESTFTIYDCDMVTEISTYSQDAYGAITESGLEGLGQVDIQTNLPKCKRLQKLILNYTAAVPNTQLSNSGFDLSGNKMLKELIVTYNISLTKAVTVYSEQIEKIDFTGTPIVGITIPTTSALKTVRLGSAIKKLELSDFDQLTELTLQGIGSLTSIAVAGCPKVNTQTLIERCLSRSEGMIMESIVLDNINWMDFSVEYLMRLCEMGAQLRGKISLLTTSANTITGAQKSKLLAMYGNIDSITNELYVDYTKVSVSNLTPIGPTIVDHVGDYALDLVAAPTKGNNFSSIVWSMPVNEWATINSRTGVVKVLKLGTTTNKPKATITVTMTLLDGTTKAATLEFLFYARQAEVGDYVYADGSYSDTYNRNKTVVGICFYINGNDRRLVMCKNLQSSLIWGMQADIPALTNYTTADGSSTNINLNDSTYLLDGEFKTLMAGSLSDWNGKENTDKILAFRNEKLLQADLEIPNTSALLLSYSSAWSNTSTNPYMPCASVCNLYEVEVQEDEVLNPLFAKGKWYLPSMGELGRIGYYNERGYVEGVSNAVFAKAKNQLDSRGYEVFEPLVSNGSTTSYKSSTEYSSSMVYGYSSHANSKGTVASNGGQKVTTGPVRAVCKF